MEDLLIEIEQLEEKSKKILAQFPELEVMVRANLQKIIRKLSKQIGKID